MQERELDIYCSTSSSQLTFTQSETIFHFRFTIERSSLEKRIKFQVNLNPSDNLTALFEPHLLLVRRRLALLAKVNYTTNQVPNLPLWSCSLGFGLPNPFCT